MYDCWEVVSKDQEEALVTFVQVLSQANFKSRKIRLKGLNPEMDYRLEQTGQIYGRRCTDVCRISCTEGTPGFCQPDISFC